LRLNFKNNNWHMIIVPVKEGENIDRALKKFKRKFEKTGVVRELRNRQAYIKPSVRRREEVKKAIYIQKLQEGEE
jgi:small subunit ribosomal protein S21